MSQTTSDRADPASYPENIAPTLPRRLVGVSRLGAGLLVLASIITQIVDQSLNDAFLPGEYFSYFTIQTSLMNVVVLIVAGVIALRRRRDSELLTTLRVSILSYAVVTGVVYNVLLRDIVSDGFVGVQWPNEVIHVWVPIFIALDFLLAPGRHPLGWNRLFFAVVYPLAWVALTLVRGAATGWYPYPFLIPDGPDGALGVFVYVLGIAGFIVVIASIGIAVSRIGGRRARAA